jgi:hypothetical protein
MPELDGLDVYEGQGVIDWPAVPALTFVAAKATQYRTDRFFSRNWQAMRERAFPVRAAYHFVTTEPASIQARRFRSVVGELEPGEVPALDYEPSGDIPVLERGFALEVRDAVEDAFGREALIYVGAWYANARAIIGHRPWWFPSYGVSEARAQSQALGIVGVVPHVWQWGGGNEGADVPGVTPGRRDDSNDVLRPAELIAWAGSPASPPSPTGPAGPRSRPMIEFINPLGAKERVALFADGGIYGRFELEPGGGRFSGWSKLVDGAFQDLGSEAHVAPATADSPGGVFIGAVGHQNYGSVDFTLAQAGPGNPYELAVSDHLSAFFADQAKGK